MTRSIARSPAPRVLAAAVLWAGLMLSGTSSAQAPPVSPAEPKEPPPAVASEGIPPWQIALGAVVAAGLAAAGFIFAAVSSDEFCEAGEFTQTERRTCPPGQVVERECCTKSDGQRRCEPFPVCPRISPS